jgi:hypothetical protein
MREWGWAAAALLFMPSGCGSAASPGKGVPLGVAICGLTSPKDVARGGTVLTVINGPGEPTWVDQVIDPAMTAPQSCASGAYIYSVPAAQVAGFTADLFRYDTSAHEGLVIGSISVKEPLGPGVCFDHGGPVKAVLVAEATSECVGPETNPLDSSSCSEWQLAAGVGMRTCECADGTMDSGELIIN